MERLKDRVALVTGGGGRIGAATAKRLASEGAKVVIADIDKQGASRIADEIGAKAFAVEFDAEEPQSIKRMVEQAVEEFGRIDILHNNAAMLDPAVLNRDTNAVDISIDTWDRTMAVNARGYLLVCKHVIPLMREIGGGSIINTSSNAAAAGDTARIAYASSKAAIVTLTQYIATQHGRENIRCNAIMPGLILDKPLEERVPDLAKLTLRHLLLTRNGRPEDVAALVAFLASDDSAFITGQTIRCDGGLVSHQPFFADTLGGYSL